jgi:hypothetical protein
MRESEQHAIGGYDFIEFSIPVQFDKQGAAGTLTLELDEGRLDEKQFIAPRLAIEYHISHGWHKWAAFFGGFLVLIAAGISTGHPLVYQVLGLTERTEGAIDLVVPLLETTILALGITTMLPLVLRYLR